MALPTVTSLIFRNKLGDLRHPPMYFLEIFKKEDIYYTYKISNATPFNYNG